MRGVHIFDLQNLLALKYNNLYDDDVNLSGKYFLRVPHAHLCYHNHRL